MRIRAALLALPLLALAACSSTSGSAPDASASGSAAASASTTQVTLGPAVPAETVVGTTAPAAQLPTVSGGYGTKPTITFPTTNPVPSLQRQVLSKGAGTTIEPGDWIEVKYLGQVWGGDVFDSNFDATFQHDTAFWFEAGPSGSVVPGWQYGVVGMSQGSRIMLSLPPADGYGAAGNAPKISGTDTIVFVIDIQQVVKSTQGGQADATPQVLPPGLPTVGGDLGKEPTITIGSAQQPSSNGVYVLAKGTGPAIVAGTVLCQLVETDWGTDGTTTSTWGTAAAGDSSSTKGLQAIPITATDASTGSPSLTAALIGLPVGSRVMLVVPPSTDSSTGSTTPAAALVIDLVAQTDITATTSPSGSTTAPTS